MASHSVKALAAFVLLAVSVCSACGGSTSGTSRDAVTERAAPDGVGSTLGGCPAAEPRAGSECSVKGRLCTWTQSCGAIDTGWCTAGGTWRVATGTCQAGCPPEPTVALRTGGGAPDSPDGGPREPDVSGPSCAAGLTCSYPSTPLGGGETCSCESSGQWGSMCSSNDDGWVPAPASNGSECKELAACGGRSGCADTCPSTAPRDCGCGPDGLMYCQIKESCAGGGAKTGTSTGQ